ncbi:MAG: Gfo/Idh/MocA family oxidoreductase [Nitrosospira sp.]|nr:Gfo/Idh/MocA family oxidoreductase [Nitrosospira sp.]
MTGSFRLAIIGSGLITQASHLPAALALPKVQVTAIIDPAPARAAQVAASYGISPLIFGSIDDMQNAKACQIDGAVIATPNHTHKDLAIRCLEAGISVLIEKPLANSVADGLAIAEAAEQAGRVAAVGYWRHFSGITPLLKEVVDQQYFGTVKRFVHQFGTEGGWAPLSAYNLDRRTAGGGVLVVSGSHFIDQLLYLWGYPDTVEFRDDSAGGPEGHCEAVFNFGGESGPITGIARYSKTTRIPGGLVLETDRGILTVTESGEGSIEFRAAASPGIVQTISRGTRTGAATDEFVLQLQDFVDACLERRPPRVTARQGIESLRLIELLYSQRKPMAQDWYSGRGHKDE